jgi:L-ascorbate metabolism protein UlaG (beta-lactamase superfamily)
MNRSRRTFLKYVAAGTGAAVGSAAWWISVSQRRAARWTRRLLADSRRSIAPAPVKPSPRDWSDNRITLSWLGHSTVLLNFYGLHILTDPVLGNRVGLSLGLGTVGPKRFIAPALRFEELPPIDIVLLSHAHMDHLDLPTLRQLPPQTFTLTAKLTSDLLADTWLKQVTEMPWGGRATYRGAKGELQVEAVEVNHWGARWPSNLERGYNGYILRREGKAILFAGDTARTSLFADLRSRGPFELAIMPIGSYRPWIRYHCSPEQALGMANAARARYLVPVHHQTFCLSEEPMTEPIERLTTALHAEPERLALRRVGETFVWPAA